MWEGGGGRYSEHKYSSTLLLLFYHYAVALADVSPFLLNEIEQCDLKGFFFPYFLHNVEAKHIEKGNLPPPPPLITLHHLWLTADIYFSDILAMLLLNVKKQSNLSHTLYSKLCHSSVIHNEFLPLHLCHFSSSLLFSVNTRLLSSQISAI